MRITISYETGVQLDGVVLSVEDIFMRVALRNSEDVAEFRYERGRWYAESGLPIHVDSLLVSSQNEWDIFETRLMAMTVN
jgi:hypothetical protein